MPPTLAAESYAKTKVTLYSDPSKWTYAPRRSILVRWGIGTITANDDTATAVTQETWSNQETDAVAPEQATVRVTYTLLWEAKVGRRLIVETSQMPL